MQPRIVKRGELCIAGLTGDGSKTAEVWSEFETRYDRSPFPKTDEYGYEVRFYGDEKPAGMDIHVGFLTVKSNFTNEFTVIELPASEYAIFDICIKNGYDSGNAEMDKWLADNAAVYKQLTLDGAGYIIEVYKDEKFANSIVEFWIPVGKAAKNA